MAAIRWLFVILILSSSAWATEPKRTPSKDVPCGILRKFDGDVQILDSTRNHLVSTRVKAPVPCGSWITVKDGWAEIKHRQGYVLKVGSNSFIEIFDNQGDRHWTGKDQVVLYRGKVYVRSAKGSDELSVLTANARSRLNRGVMMVIYRPEEEETQLISLENKAILENRFEMKGKRTVGHGELTMLNFQQLRVVPSTPKAVTVASLKMLLHDLPMNKLEKRSALIAVMKRGERKFASKLNYKKPTKSMTTQRKPAATGDPAAKKKWMNSIVGGSPSADDLLFPGERRSARVMIRDPAEDLLREKEKSEKKEKRKLMQKISEMRQY